MAVWMPLLLEKDNALSINTCIQYTYIDLATSTRDTKAVFSDQVIIRRLRHASILLCYIVQRA